MASSRAKLFAAMTRLNVVSSHRMTFGRLRSMTFGRLRSEACSTDAKLYWAAETSLFSKYFWSEKIAVVFSAATRVAMATCVDSCAISTLSCLHSWFYLNSAIMPAASASNITRAFRRQGITLKTPVKYGSGRVLRTVVLQG